MVKIEKSSTEKNTIAKFFYTNWIAILIISILCLCVFFSAFFYKNNEVFQSYTDEFLGNNTPEKTLRISINAYKDKDLKTLEKYVYIDKIADGIVDDIIKEISEDKKYFAIFSTNDAKSLFSSRVKEIRDEYKENIRKYVLGQMLDVNWSILGETIVEDKLINYLHSANYSNNGVIASFEIKAKDEVITIIMEKIDREWRIVRLKVKESWSNVF